MDPEVSYRVSPDVITHPIEDELVLLDLKSQHYYALDGTGRRMWELLAERGTIDAVADQMCLEFEVDRNRVFGDIASMVEDFRAAGLVVGN